MPMYFVVARDARHQYEEMKQIFATEPGVEVILDRRYGDRRNREWAPPHERRRRDRRVRRGRSSEEPEA